MKVKLLDDHHAARTFAVVFDAGDSVLDGLLRFATEHDLTGASFTAIGAFRRATLGFFDVERKDYAEIEIDEQMEVLTLAGNVGHHRTAEGDEIKVHAHVVVGLGDGSAKGGHLLSAEVRPTLEVVVQETSSALRRTIDDATGLPLIDLDA